jgi:hypothetical protein
MPKFAVYQALMARNDWAAERQGRAMNMQAMAQLEQRAKARTQEQLQSQAQIGKLFRDLENMPVNEEDVSRVQEAEMRERKNIIAGIKKYNGDLNAYVKSGGALAIDNYKANVMQSQEMQSALANKNNLGLAVKAMQDGKYVKPVTVKIPGEDEEGNPIYTNKQMSFNDAYAMYKSGEITELPYFGEEDKVDVNAFDFKDDYKDADNPFGDNTVTESDVYDVALMKGASEQQARELANTYGRGAMESGNTWNWGSNRMVQDKLAQQKLDLDKRKFNWQRSQARAASGRLKITDALTTQLQSMAPNSEIEIDFKSHDMWADQLKANKNEDGSYSFPGLRSATNKMFPELNYDLSKATSTVFDKYVRTIGADGQPTLGIQTISQWNDDVEGEGTPLEDNFFVDSPANKHVNAVVKNEEGGYTTYDIIPIDSYMRNEVFRQTLNQSMGLKNEYGSTVTAPYKTNEGMLQNMLNTVLSFQTKNAEN